jgi:DNA polymerase III subunit epsilon
MREIVLDTETTGLDPAAGHRIVEIGCIELLNHVPTGMTFHRLINPDRSMPTAAFEVHGLSDELLAKQPRFAKVADDFLEFIADSPLVIHNAAFDLGFVNAELAKCGLPPLADTRAVDTVSMARRKYPGAPASLDALCRRFAIDLGGRAKHGALVDAELLAAVYLELLGGRQPGLGFGLEANAVRHTERRREARPARSFAPTADERAAHAAFVATLADPIWES